MNTKSFHQIEIDEPIGLEEQSAIAYLIKKFAMEKLGYSRVKVSSFELMRNKPQTKVNIAFSSRLNDLYFRFGKYPFGVYKDKKYIVVARIGFRKKKNGYGTALLKELCTFGEKYGYEYLEIERPNLDCQAFMKKLGFKDEFYLPIKELKQSIREYEFLRIA